MKLRDPVKRKILFITHQLAFNFFGGMEVQILKYRELLRSFYDVKLFNPWEDKIENYDAVHIFGLTVFPNESFAIAQYAKRMGLKVIISPVFWYPGAKAYDSPLKLFIYKAYSYSWRVLTSLTRYPRLPYMYKLTLSLADIILPNTREEMELLIKIFGIPRYKFRIVHNGVDSRFANDYAEIFKQKYNLPGDYILFVGRIEKRKNVHRLIEAFSKAELDTVLVIVGKIADPNYYEYCKKRANSKVLFIPPLPHESLELASAYKSAKVFALPSYYETPGIAALEAAVAGANIVITKNGGTREYFGEYAWYVDPMSTKSIEDALIAAFYAPRRKDLQKFLLENFSWENIGKELLTAYSEVFSDKK